jgi:O-antigen/teichoic acid export membrane protein
MKQKSLFKNSIYKAILTIVNIIIPIFIGPYIARVLDVGLYGQYNKAYSEMQVFLIFAAFGVYNFGVREISKIRDDKKKVSQLFTNLFVISLISNIIVLALYL